MRSIGDLFEAKRPAGVSKRAFAISLGIEPSVYYRWTKTPDIVPNLLDLFKYGKKVGITRSEILEVSEYIRSEKR
jgi:hypothetical protein